MSNILFIAVCYCLALCLIFLPVHNVKVTGEPECESFFFLFLLVYFVDIFQFLGCSAFREIPYAPFSPDSFQLDKFDAQSLEVVRFRNLKMI